MSPLSVAGFLACLGLGGFLVALLGSARQPDWVISLALLVCRVPGFYFLFALKMANEWEKAILLRAGKFRGLRGPGLFWIVPALDKIPV